MRRILQFCMALALCLGLALSAQAAGSLLVDDANLLTEGQAANLLEALEEARQKWEMDIVVVTVDSLEGKSAERYADDFYDYGGYRDSGVLLLVAMTEREWHITTSGSAIAALSDEDLANLSREFLPALSAGDYSGAFAAFVRGCDRYLTPEKGKSPRLSPLWVIVSLGVGVAAAFAVTGGMKRQLKSTAPRMAADACLAPGSLHLTQSQDVFLYQTVARVARPKDTSGPSSSHSTTHTGSSGHTHGGAGGKF